MSGYNSKFEFEHIIWSLFNIPTRTLAFIHLFLLHNCIALYHATLRFTVYSNFLFHFLRNSNKQYPIFHLNVTDITINLD